MKKIIKCMLYVVCFAWLTSCEDMNSVSQEYLDRGEEIYIARVDSIQSISGLNKVQFKWWIKSDPRITEVEIKWIEGTKVKDTTISVVRTQSGAFAMETVLKNIPEGAYFFEFRTKDDHGHSSVSLGKTVEIIGSRYLETMHNRPITSAILPDNSIMTIKWESNPTYSIGCYLNYTDVNNQEKELFVPALETVTEVSGYKSGLSYYTRCVPPVAPLDTLDVEAVNLTVKESMPFNGPHTLSASPKEIWCRDFDYGGEGLAFHDSNANNESNGHYRADNGDPAGEAADCHSSDGSIGYSNPGEWFVYTVDVQDAGTYEFDLEYTAGGNDRIFFISVDGIQVSEQIQIPHDGNGNWNSYRYAFATYPDLQPKQPKINLTAGKHKFRFTYVSAGFNIRLFKFTRTGD